MTGRVLESARHGYRLARAIGRQFPGEAAIAPAVTVDALDPGFLEGEAAYNGLGVAADGTVFFSVGTKALDAGARVFAARTDAHHVRLVTDLDRALRPAAPAAVPHGKMHVDFAEIGGRMFGATHVGHYALVDGVERPSTPAGWAPYPGGVFFELTGGGAVPCGSAPAGEGVIAMTADAVRVRLHALTWPGGRLLTADVASGSVYDHGPVFGPAETGSRAAGTWHRVCRSLGVDERTGRVYWSDREGSIHCLEERGIRTLGTRLPSHDMWRKVAWHASREIFYVLTEGGRLCTFDPVREECRDIGRLAPADAGRRATLAFAVDAERGAVHHLATGRGAWRGVRQPPLLSTVWHCVHDLTSATTAVRGVLRLPDGRFVTEAQSLAVVGDTLCGTMWVEVPPTDRSPRAHALRQRRRDTEEYRVRGYAEEILFVRLPGVAPPGGSDRSAARC